MKKIKYILFGTVILTSFVGGTGKVLAADTLSGNTTVTTNVVPGDLSVLPTKTIDFGTVTLNGKDQIVNENKSTVEVSDFRGIGSGWTLTLKEEQEIKGLEMKVAPSIDAKSTAATVSGEFSLNTQDHKFAEVTKASAKSHPLEELDTAMKLNSKLKLAKDLASKSYSMNLVWTLIAGPK
ncbi:WxL domain-containing protein [Enterococcus faecium]|nr:WxL domain-containing protein [Enterococcus faecium]